MDGLTQLRFHRFSSDEFILCEYYGFPCIKCLLFHVNSGWGCDTAVVIDILAHRDAIQRALIQQDYRAMYSEDLCKRLSSELSGKLEVPL